MDVKDWILLGGAAVMAVVGYFTKRLIDGKAESGDMKSLIQQLEGHVTACNERNRDVAEALRGIGDKLATTAEHVAKITGHLQL